MRRIFVDMDGTLAVWNNVEFEQLFEEGYYRNLKPNFDILIEVEELINRGEDVYILSCVLPESKYALEEKKAWLREYLPNLSEDKYIFVPYGRNKADYLKEHYSPITSSDYLVDDYTQNLLEWREFGGKGVKYLNGINHTRGTWDGQMIYTVKVDKSIPESKDTGLIRLLTLERAKELINNFCDSEYNSEADFSDLHEVHIAYTTLTDEELPIQVSVDLIHYKILYECDGEIFNVDKHDSLESMINHFDKYDSLESMINHALSYLDLDEMISVPDSVLEKLADIIYSTESQDFEEDCEPEI